MTRRIGSCGGQNTDERCKFMASLEPSLALKSWNLLTSTKPWDTASLECTHGSHLYLPDCTSQ